jgi:hypothetical protein
MLVSTTSLTSSELNRGIWAKATAGARRIPLSVDGQLSDSICESVNKVEHCQTWIMHQLLHFQSAKKGAKTCKIQYLISVIFE